MWVETTKLEKIENLLEFDTEKKQKILITYYYINNNYYQLLKKDVIIEVIKYSKELNLKNLSDLLYFFYEEIDIISGWYDLNNDFQKKFKNIFNTIKFLQENIHKIPIYTQKSNNNFLI